MMLYTMKEIAAQIGADYQDVSLALAGVPNHGKRGKALLFEAGEAAEEMRPFFQRKREKLSRRLEKVELALKRLEEL